MGTAKSGGQDAGAERQPRLAERKHIPEKEKCNSQDQRMAAWLRINGTWKSRINTRNPDVPGEAGEEVGDEIS